MKSTFSVIYYLKRQVVKKDGTVPVMGRITVDGSQTQFSCKLTIDPNQRTNQKLVLTPAAIRPSTSVGIRGSSGTGTRKDPCRVPS